jgi:hypothetical protein
MEFRTNWGWGGIGSACNRSARRHDVRTRLLAISLFTYQEPFEGLLQGNINIAPSVEKGCLLHAAQLFLRLRAITAQRGGAAWRRRQLRLVSCTTDSWPNSTLVECDAGSG